MKTLSRTAGSLLWISLSACSLLHPSRPLRADAAETRAIAADAFLYGLPITRSYGLVYAHGGDPGNPIPWNEVRNEARPATPEDAAPATPLMDTLSSWLGIDVRSEPLVLSLPALEPKRMFWVQLIDLVKNNPARFSSRTSGNAGGNFLLAKAGWTGEKPSGIKGVVSLETDLALAVIRIQVLAGESPDAVQAIRSGITVQSLSAFQKKPAPPAPAPMALVEPLSPTEELRSPRFFAVLAFALQFCPAPASEREFRKRLGRIGLVAGKPFNPEDQPQETREALSEGMADAWRNYREHKKLADAKEIPVADLPPSVDLPRSPWMGRFATFLTEPPDQWKEVVTMPLAPYDWDGLPLDGGGYRYVLHFYPDLLPPAAEFWSLTAYDEPSGRLVPNPRGRYNLQSSMTGLKWDEDGGLTIRVQADPPGGDLDSNWLPVPRHHFLLVLRLYGPKVEPAKSRWAPPYLRKAT